MGSACCVAARENTVPSVSGDELLNRNIRYSPAWSFRWENRGRVAGEDASVGWLYDGISRQNGSETKIEDARASEDGSSLDSSSFLRFAWPKSPFSEGAPGHVRTPPSDQSISRNLSIDANIEQAESKESPAISSFTKAQLSLPSLPSTSIPSNSTPSRCPTSGSLNCQSTSEEKPMVPSRSFGGSSDSWSVNAFSELMAASHRANWSIESEPFGLDKVSKSSSRVSNSEDPQTCRICMKIISNNRLSLSVVAVLICGHVYHADCLERMTPELDRYDPACPVCTFGEKQTFKMSEKALKAEFVSRVKKSKKSKNQVVDEEVIGDYDYHKNGNVNGMKSSSPNPFFRRHFSFTLKGSPSPSLSEDTCSRKKRFFWSKSSKG